MIRQIIAYIVVFLLTLYCFFLYDHEIITIMLLLEHIYFVAAFLWLIYLQGRIDVFMDTVIPMAEKNQKIPIVIKVRNKSKIARVHVKLFVQVKNSFTGEKKKFSSSAIISRNRIENVNFALQVKNCGNVSVSLKACWIYDILNIFKWKWKGKTVHQITILPECHLIPVEITKKTREFLVEGEDYSDRESGDDPSEIFQIREYQEKDSLRDIHWKLSAKVDELMVKEHARPLGSAVLIWLNLQTDAKAKKRIPSVILETVASLSLSLHEKECMHTVAWYDVKSQSILKQVIKKEENVYELLNYLLSMQTYKENVDSQYEEALGEETFSTRVKVCIDGTIFVNEEEKMKVPMQEEQVVWEQLYFIV